MKLTVAILLCAWAIAMAESTFHPDLDEDWKKFKTSFNKKYDMDEEPARRSFWEDNMAAIKKHNMEYDQGIHSYKLAPNPYSDMSTEEFANQMNGFKLDESSTNGDTFDADQYSDDLPETVDWRDEGYVTEIKQQMPCLSCWAFAATGALEGQHKKATGELVSLSEQNLVDCSAYEGNLGCQMGWPAKAFQYIIDNGGIDTEDSYPYTYKNETGPCHYDPAHVGATVKAYKGIPKGDESALKKAVANIGPISVAIDGGKQSFKHFSGEGIYNNPHCNNIDSNHCVLVIGYGTDNGTDYWLIKNSWGTDWGDNGYGKMSRNNLNQCGIANYAYYPIV